MTAINPYLFFPGNCREAMTFYKDCFGGELTIQTVQESPVAEQMPAADRQKILHSSLVKDTLLLMASDLMDGKANHGNSISLAINCDSEDQIHTLFSKLSTGGKVTQPLAKQFWGAIYGQLTDKFGINWMLNYSESSKK